MGTAVYRNANLKHHRSPLPEPISQRLDAAEDVAAGRVDACRLAVSVVGLTVYLGAPLAALVYFGVAATRWFSGV